MEEVGSGDQMALRRVIAMIATAIKAQPIGVANIIEPMDLKAVIVVFPEASCF